MPKPTIGTDHPDFPHGTERGYHRKCRCVDCKKAHAEDVRRSYLRTHPEPKAPYRKHGRDVKHPDFPHGSNAGFAAGCRCEECKEANRISFLEYSREHRIPGTPGGLKKKIANAVYQKTPKGLASSRKGNATRYARIRGAVVSDNAEDQRLVRLIYANCPEGYEVDHILPLSRGGAHVSSNLQYLPLSVNRQKNNRLDYDVAEHAISWESILEAPSTIIPSREYA